MNARKIALAVALVSIALVSSSCGNSLKGKVAVLDTSYGRVVIQLLPGDAPKNTANFAQLVKAGFYDGTRFHRIVRAGSSSVAIQGGDPNTVNGDRSTWGQGQQGQKTVVGEFSKTLRHVRGTVSMARQPNDENSATSQFFICAGPYPQWDGHYSIFGRVIQGMNVVDAMVNAPVWPNTEMPQDPVVIKKAYIADEASIR